MIPGKSNENQIQDQDNVTGLNKIVKDFKNFFIRPAGTNSKTFLRKKSDAQNLQIS